MCRIAALVLVISGLWVLVAVGSSREAIAGPKTGEAKLAGGKPPKARSSPKSTGVSPGAGAKLAVRWTKHVRLENLADLEKYEALIRTPLGDCQELAAMTSPGNAAARVRPPCTCAEYFGMDEGAYSPETTAEMNWLMSCELRCEPLRWLHQARAARVSYLRDLRLTEDTLRSLPPSLAPPSLSNLLDRDGAGPEEDAWPRVLKQGTVKQIDPNTVGITGDDFETTLMLLGWGDINADGIEDVLVWVEHRATGGTLRVGATHTLTRLKSSGPITLLKQTGTGQQTG